MSQVVLLLSCQDRPGIVAAVTNWVATNGGNITDAQQHTDHHDGMFFQRVQFSVSQERSHVELRQSFDRLAGSLGLTYRFCSLPHRPRTAILVSRHLHCLTDILTRVHLADLSLDVRFVASNHDDAAEVSHMYGCRFEHVAVPPGVNGRSEQEHRLAELLRSEALDLVLLARYMLVLPAPIVDEWTGRMINIHHSFLPSFVGANPYRQAHDRGVKLIGATAHYVTAVLDEGPIIAQQVTAVSHRDDVAALTRRGRDLETLVLADAVRAHLEHRILQFGNRTIVFD